MSVRRPTIPPSAPQAPSIAVIVPNWNDARYLRRCITSVLDQDVPPDELILVDDHSTDDSVSLMHTLIDNNPRAKLVVNPVNLGTYGAVDEGLKRTGADYVLFLASNDFVLPGIFERARSCLARNPGVGLWSAMMWLVDENDVPIRLHPSAVPSLQDAHFPPAQCVRLAYRFGYWFTGSTLIYHRETLIAAGGFDPFYKGLSDLLTALIVASRRGAVFSPEPFAAMRIHAGSYLSNTLADAKTVETMIGRLREDGPKLEPRLFTPAYLDRLALRFQFAAIRGFGGAGVGDIASKAIGPRRRALRLIDRIVPSGMRRTRVALAFVILRPFDIVPTIWYRFFRTAVVLLRVRVRNRGAPQQP